MQAEALFNVLLYSVLLGFDALTREQYFNVVTKVEPLLLELFTHCVCCH